MLDEYIAACVCMVSLRCRNLSTDETLAMLENSAHCARGAGARLFGWHQRSDPRLLQRNDPFGVHHWVGGAVGVVRDANGGVPVWDELLKCKCDIDATLEELMVNRLVWNEARFCFVQERDGNPSPTTPSTATHKRGARWASRRPSFSGMSKPYWSHSSRASSMI